MMTVHEALMAIILRIYKSQPGRSLIDNKRSRKRRLSLAIKPSFIFNTGFIFSTYPPSNVLGPLLTMTYGEKITS